MANYTVKQIPNPSGKVKANGKDKYRYIVVDSETGDILDNAQGYGYKSIDNAHKAYCYKLNRFSQNNNQN